MAVIEEKTFIASAVETIKTIFYALLIAGIFRTLFFQPFWIPSGSMKDTLLIGDFLFVNKMAYGYSYASCPKVQIPSFGVNIDADDFCGFLKNRDTRILGGDPKRGDVVVFRHPVTGADYIKRLIGLPGDKIQMPVSVNSHRIGRAFGTHRVDFYNSGETISFQHIAHSRDIFASGAIAAAQWIISNPPGLYSFDDYLNKKL